MPDYPASLAATELARKYQYLINGLTKLWVQNNFALTNFKRAAGRLASGGRQSIIPLETGTNGSFRFMLPGEAPAEAGTATYDEAIVNFAAWSVSIENDWFAMKAGQTDKQSFINIRTKQVTDAVEVMGNRWSHALFAGPDNAMARIESDLGAGVFQLYADTDPLGGGTFGARFMFQNGLLNGSVTKVGYNPDLAGDYTTVSADPILDRVTLTGTGLVALQASVAGGDKPYLFWGSHDRSSMGRGIDGLPKLVNDGVDYAVFEGRDRTAADGVNWQATVHRTFGAGNIEKEILSQMRTLDKRIAMTTDVIMYGLEVQNMHFEQMAANRRNMIPVTDFKGGPTFSGGFEALPVSYGTRKVAAVSNREIPDFLMYGLNWECVALSMLSDPEWLNEGEGMYKYVPDTTRWKAHLIAAGNVASANPQGNWLTTGITP